MGRLENATAETERRWRIRGVYPNGGRLQFAVNAFDHAEARAKAERKSGAAEILDVMLWEGRARG